MHVSGIPARTARLPQIEGSGKHSYIVTVNLSPDNLSDLLKKSTSDSMLFNALARGYARPAIYAAHQETPHLLSGPGKTTRRARTAEDFIIGADSPQVLAYWTGLFEQAEQGNVALQGLISCSENSYPNQASFKSLAFLELIIDYDNVV